MAPRVPPPNAKVGGFLGCLIALLGTFEGVRTYAYNDSVGVPTVCYGHTKGVKAGQHYTLAECNKMLIADIPKYDPNNLGCIKVVLPPKRHSALLSFAYNVGPGTFCRSSVVRKINAGNVQGGCDALLHYDYAKGHHLKGLTSRRKAERVLCLQKD